VCDSGFEHFFAQPFDPVRDDGLADRCDREGQSVTRLAHGFLVGDPDGGRGERGVAQSHLGGDEQLHQRVDTDLGVGGLGAKVWRNPCVHECASGAVSVDARATKRPQHPVLANQQSTSS
jgi:hypothetical protein